MDSKHSPPGESVSFNDDGLVSFFNISPEQQPLLRTVEPYNTSADQKDTYDSGKQCLAVNRKKLQETLCQYTFDTLGHIATLSEFCLSRSKWEEEMTANITKLKDIKEKEEGKSKNKIKGALKFLKNKLTPQIILDRRREELKQELDDVFKVIIRGLEKLKEFVDAVERLAVTSRHVFVENNQVLQLPEETSLKNVQDVITAAIKACPLLLQVKRETSTFFSPSLRNVEVHSVYLDEYISNTKKICNMMEESFVREFEKMKNTKTVVQLPADLSEVDIQDMLHHIEYLTAIRKDQHFRVGFLFQDDSFSVIIKEFSERETRMLQFLTELEKTAVKLDRMKKGAQISSVAGSSVGVISIVLGILGLAAIPLTGGVSLALTMTAAVMGVTVAVGSIVRTSTELGVNATQKKKAKKRFHKIQEDLGVFQVCLEKVSNKALEKDIVKEVLEAGGIIKNVHNAGLGISQTLVFIDELHFFLIQGIHFRFIDPYIPNCLNVFGFLFHVYSIVTNSLDLAKGSQSEVSQFIRARASLWHSELDSWEKIHDSLSKSMTTSGEKKNKLERPFYSLVGPPSGNLIFI